jgi:glycolate oxidase iron-sulfur subunit
MSEMHATGPELAKHFRKYAGTLDCVHCGLCLEDCPTYGITRREADSPRGRIYLMRGWAEGRIAVSDEARRHLDLCIVCRACESVCPSGVRMGQLAASFRTTLNRERPTGLAASRSGRFFLRHILPSRRAIATASDFLELYQRAGLRRPVGAILSRLSGRLARLHELQPDIPARSLRRIATDRTQPAGFPAIGERRHRVGLFLGCIASEWYAHVHRATIRVLNRNGCDVVVPDEQTCCGALHEHAGLLDEAHELLERNARAFARAGVDAVIVNAAGCGATLKEGPSALPVRDVCEFLAEIDLVKPARPVPKHVAYDQPCHLQHGQRIGEDVVLGLLRLIPELEIIPLAHNDRCCGAGGVYNLLHAEIADALLAEKVAAIRESGADTVVTGNPGCDLQLRYGLAGTGVAVAHPVELLDHAYA